ncbi:hypothetical protein ES708_12634 [subsurface metagenome]
MLYRVGSPGTVTVSIRATDGEGKPTGDDLCSGTTNGNTLPTYENPGWREITLGDGYNLDADTMYAIVVRAPNGSESNEIRWRDDASSPTYTGGTALYSGNSGSTWYLYGYIDFMFEEWGEPPTVELAGVSSGVCSTTADLLNIKWLSGLSAGVASVNGLTFITYKLAGASFGKASVIGRLAQLFEHYIVDDNESAGLYGIYWRAQTFTPSIAHKIASVRLKLLRYGSPGTITVSIRATDENGHPTGGDLCSGTTNGNTLPTHPSAEWREITLGAGYDLDADTMYAIVVRALDSDDADYPAWRRDSGAPAYIGGCWEASNDSGNTWTGYKVIDGMFEEWGGPIVVELAGVSSGVCDVSGLTVITYKLAGIASGVCSVSGIVGIYQLLAGVIAGEATVTGSLFHMRAAVRNLLAIRNLPAVRNLPPVR